MCHCNRQKLLVARAAKGGTLRKPHGSERTTSRRQTSRSSSIWVDSLNLDGFLLSALNLKLLRPVLLMHSKLGGLSFCDPNVASRWSSWWELLGKMMREMRDPVLFRLWNVDSWQSESEFASLPESKAKSKSESQCSGFMDDEMMRRELT